MEPHTVLGVSANASVKDINDAFKALAMKWHPDRNPGNVEEATEMMKEINIAKKAMLRRAERAKTRASAEESSSSPAHQNPSSGSECSASSSHHASSVHTSESSTPSCEGSEQNSRKPPPPTRKQSRDSDHRPQSTFSSFLPKPFRRRALSTINPPPSPDLNVTNAYDNCFLMGRISKEWVHPIKLSLEDLLHGKRFNVRLERYQLSGTRRPVVFAINVPPGCEAGTRMVFKEAGHENKDGQKQDIVFVIEEANHKEFTRTGNNLSINVEVPWDDKLTQGKQRMPLEGLGGEGLAFTIDHCSNNAMKGTAVVPAAGMPDPSGRRGNLLVHWEISKTGSQWLRKVFRG